jgi:prepilin-type N-terminal cleavage/methylation domain-containing protein
MNRGARQRGFTLIELLVAITLASLATVLGAAVLRAGIDYVQRTRDYLRTQEDLRAATKTVRFMWQGRLPDNFIGLSDVVEFSSRRIDAPAGYIATRVQLSCRVDERGYVLHRDLLVDSQLQVQIELRKAEQLKQAQDGQRDPGNKPPPDSKPPGDAKPPAEEKPRKVEWLLVAQEDMLKGLSHCSFAYLQAVTNKDKKTAAWLDVWPEVGPPRLFRLNLGVRSGRLPPLIFTAL